MKSIVEQASSVMKAIENGWLQAGKPAEFTVKIYEHGVRNFFGMSVEPAKICILYEDKTPKNTSPKNQQRPESHTKHAFEQTQHRKEKDLDTHKEQRKQKQQQPPVAKKSLFDESKDLFELAGQEEQAPVASSSKILWTNELVDASKQWLTTTLAVMNKPHATFTMDIKKYHLIITFDHPVLEDKEREKALFRSFAYVLMQSLRNRFKKGLRGYRIILNAHQV